MTVITAEAISALGDTLRIASATRNSVAPLSTASSTISILLALDTDSFIDFEISSVVLPLVSVD